MCERLLYNEFNHFLKGQFSFKVQKIAVNAGFSCPNRDGTVGVGGCSYCNNQTFNPAYCTPNQSVTAQLMAGKAFFARKYPAMKYLAYFQAYTNTYGNLQQLIGLYEEALAVDDVVGLVIATRPDCMPPLLLQYLEKLSQQTFLLVEYGVECTNELILRRINRGHSFATAAETIRQTASRGIRTGAHTILGLPGETRQSLLAQAVAMSALPITTIKLHQLQLIRGTAMATEYEAHPERFLHFTPETYADLVVDYLRLLRSNIVVDRFLSQAPPSLLIAPAWGLKNYQFVELVKQRMQRLGAKQGDRCDTNNI